MGYELNLTNDQKRRIGGAKTPEEKAAIIAEAMDAERELSEEELDSMSGGGYWIPQTKEEMERTLKFLERMQELYGGDAALIDAEEMNLGTFPRTEDHGNFLYHLKKRWTMSLEGGPQNFLDEYSS